MITFLGSCLLAGATVTLPMEAESFGTEIELGEIARVESADVELAARLRSIELGYAPAPGYSRLLRADRIRLLLQRHAPGVTIELAGHAACRVRPKVETVAASSIEEAARVRLAGIAGGVDATWEPGEPIQSVDVPAGRGAHRVRARVDGGTALASGLRSIPVDVLVDGTVYRTVWTTWRVEVWNELPVLARDVRAGETITAAMVELRRVKLDGGAKPKPLSANLLAGAVAARALVAGSTVSHVDVHRPVVVSGGDTVSLVVRKGSVTARVAAVARQSGSVGDRIRVTMVENGKELTAVVRGKDIVEVDLGR